jgi:CO dehydrogenase maturation factor
VLGAIERGGSGCACPESVILKALVADLVLRRDDCVILDMEAGLEHLGRATAQGVDLLLIVADPSRRAVETASQVRRMAGEIGIRRIAAVGNKVASPSDEAFLREAFRDIDYLGHVPYDESVRRADRENLPLVDIAPPPLLERFREIWKRVAAHS